MTRDEISSKWEERRKDIINPDGMTWDDLGFDEPPDGCSSVDEYLEADPEGERDGEDQIELRMIDEFLADLKEMEETR